MANTSTKNFPHAYGAGRCVAAFSLSHPGGPEEMGQDATSGEILSPPAFNMDPGDLPAYPDRTTSFSPYDPSDPASLGDFTVGYTPDQQPYNATSFGVYCTGSGTKALPYRTALAPYVPASVSPSLNAVLPGSDPSDNEVRPFGVVDDTRLGTTRAQYVVETREGAAPGDQPVEGAAAWYEVGLDWKIPPIKVTANYGTGAVDSNWPSIKIANVRDSLASTLWITASISDSALSECHPETDPSGGTFGSDTSGFSTFLLNSPLTANPGPGTGWEAPYGNALTYAGDPSSLGGFGTVGPNEFPMTAVAAPIEQLPMFTPKADLMLKIVSVRQRFTNTDSTGLTGGTTVATCEYQVVPVVRVLMSTIITGTAISSPIPLGRSLVRPATFDFATQPPCVNVQVWQKNSSATDGTVTPVFDLYDLWSTLGGSPT